MPEASLPGMAVLDRFRAASVNPPLSGLSAADSRELAMVLAGAAELEDLPGKWQAALLEAETAAAPRSGGCCCGHRAA